MQENRQKWVDALRSGEFVQAHGQFIERLVRRQHEGVDVEVETRYCCLAVATEVAIRSGIGTVRMRPYDSDGVLTPQVLISEAEVDPDGHEIDEVLPDGSAWVWYTDGNLPPY